MGKLNFLLIILLGHLTLSAQNVLNTSSYPIFNGSSLNLPQELALGDLKMKTQKFISETLDTAFVRKYLPKDQNIEFNIAFTIGADGKVLPENIFVNTSVDFFNLKMKSVLVKLPRFIPAKIIDSRQTQPFEYILTFTPEFFVNQNNQLIPVYRQDLPLITIYIYNDEEELIQTANKLGYYSNAQNNIANILHFSTNATKEIIDIRVFTENNAFSEKIENYILNLKVHNEKIFNKLHKNTNYAAKTNLRLSGMLPIIAGNETVVTYPGCENKVSNLEKRECMTNKIQNYIMRRFNDKIFQNIPIGEYKTHVFFQVDTTRKVVNTKVTAPYLVIEREVKRIFRLLPDMAEPGKQEGQAVVVSYYIPIVINSKAEKSSYTD